MHFASFESREYFTTISWAFDGQPAFRFWIALVINAVFSHVLDTQEVSEIPL